MRIFAPLVLIALSSSACSRTVNTLPPVSKPGAPLSEISLEIPPGLEVRSVDYDASMFSDVSGLSGQYGYTSTSVGGRAFVKVYAVERESGEQVLLLYENIAQRSKPIQIIRFRTAPLRERDSAAIEATIR